MDRSAPFLPQWNSAERAPHRVNNPDLEGLLASNIFSAALIRPDRPVSDLSEIGGLHLMSRRGERLHRRAGRRAIEALMLGVRENDENLHGDRPLTDASSSAIIGDVAALLTSFASTLALLQKYNTREE
jgi:hypothetical protein